MASARLQAYGALNPAPLNSALGDGLKPVPAVPATIVVDGVAYNLLISRATGDYLTSRSGEPLYGRAA